MLTALSQRMRAWLRRHSYSFFSSLGDLHKHRLGTLMTVLMIGIAVFLPVGLNITLKNLDRVDLAEEEFGAVTVFLSRQAAADDARQLVEDLRERAGAADVQLISPQEGLAEFRLVSGFGPALELLDSNPLPWVVSVTPKSADGGDLEVRVRELLEFLAERPEVDSAHVDRKWLERLSLLLDLGRAMVMVLSLLFGLAVVVVVFNTTRLDVAARAEEIEILALVGANNSFIRLPFLYSGFWYGLLGGIMAVVLLNLSLVYLDGPVGRLLASYGQQVELLGPDTGETLGLVFGSGLLGLVGAMIAVQRYLHELRVGGSLGRR